MLKHSKGLRYIRVTSHLLQYVQSSSGILVTVTSTSFGPFGLWGFIFSFNPRTSLALNEAKAPHFIGWLPPCIGECEWVFFPYWNLSNRSFKDSPNWKCLLCEREELCKVSVNLHPHWNTPFLPRREWRGSLMTAVVMVTPMDTTIIMPLLFASWSAMDIRMLGRKEWWPKMDVKCLKCRYCAQFHHTRLLPNKPVCMFCCGFCSWAALVFSSCLHSSYRT